VENEGLNYVQAMFRKTPQKIVVKN